MRRILCAVIITMLSVLCASAATLDSVGVLSIGDIIALQTTVALPLVKPERPTLITYDKEKKRLDVEIIGYYNDPKYARDDMEKLMAKVDPLLKAVAEHHSVTLDDANVCITYYQNGNEILKRENGQIIMN